MFLWEISAAVEEQSASTEQIVETTESLNNIAINLKSLVNKFTT